MTYIQEIINRSLAYYAHFGLTGKLPPANLDITTVTDPRVAFMDTDLFQRGSYYSFDPTAPRCDAFFCTLRHRFGMNIPLPESGMLPPFIFDHCLFEYDSMKTEPVHGVPVVLLTAETPGIPTAEAIIVSSQTYDLVGCLPNAYDRFFFFTEFLTQLCQDERSVFQSFLSSSGTAQCVFLCMCHLASQVIKSGLPPENEAELIADFYDTIVPSFSGISWVDPEDIHTLLTLSEFYSARQSWYLFLSLWAVLHGVSVWEDGTTIQKLYHLMDACRNLSPMLSLICSIEDLEMLRRMVLDDSEAFLYDPYKCGLIFQQIEQAIRQKAGGTNGFRA